MIKLGLAILGTCALVSCSAPVDETSVGMQAQSLTEPDTLRVAAAMAGRRVGAAVDVAALRADPAYGPLLSAQFSAITPENAMKWGSLQTRPHRWNFDDADYLVQYAKKHRQDVRGHALVWHNQLPAFINDSLSARRLEWAMLEHIGRTVHHFRGKLYAWDVVNEAVADDGSGLRDSIFSRKLGERYIDQAFKAAHHADRRVRLYYNDYGIEERNAKSDAVFALVSRLKARRVPIDGVGFQFHLDAAHVPSLPAMVENFQRFTSLGLTVNVSELDVRVANLAGTREQKLRAQAEVYHRVVSACLAVEKCDGVTSWGFSDKYSWIDGVFGPDDPLQFDDAFARKPAFDGERLAFLGQELPELELGPELLANGGFESGVEGFYSFGGTVESTSIAHAGSLGARVTSRSASYQGVATTVPDAAPGNKYRASAWLLSTAGEPLTLTMKVACSDHEEYLQVASTMATSTWVKLSGSVTLPTCDLQRAELYTEGPAAGVDLFVDDMSIRLEETMVSPNIVNNPGFESGLAGWTAYAGSLQLATDNPRAGSASGRVTDRTDTWQGPVYPMFGQVARATSYQADAWLRQDGTGPSRVAITAKLSCLGTGDQYLGIAEANAAPGEWVHVAGQFGIPDCGLSDAAVYAEGPPAGVDLLIDDVTVRAAF